MSVPRYFSQYIRSGWHVFDRDYSDEFAVAVCASRSQAFKIRNALNMTDFTPEERRELIDGATERYKLGEIGPIRFSALLKMYGLNATETDALVNEHRAQNEGARK